MTNILDFNNTRGLHFVHLNIRSLWKKFDQTREILKDSNVDVLGISESWLNVNTDDRLLIKPNYTKICTAISLTCPSKHHVFHHRGNMLQ